MAKDQTRDRGVKCTELQKGDYALISGMLGEVLTALALDSEQFFVRARGIYTGREFEIKLPITYEVTLPALFREDYTLLEIEGDTGYLTLADVETRDIKDDVKLPEGEMGEELKKVFAEDKEVCVTLITCQGEEGVDSFKVVDGK